MSRTLGRPPHPDLLTPSEWRVVEAVRHGLSNPQIASKLGISTNAVKFHVSNVLQKLGFATRLEIRRWDGVRLESHINQRRKSVEPIRFGSLGQVARYVTDIELATQWYRDTLGLPHLYSFGNLAFFQCDSTRLFLSVGDPTKNSVLYFTVPDIHAAHDHLIAVGVEIASAPHLIHQHEDGTEEWMAFFNDPDGQLLAVMSRVNASPERVEQ